MASSDGPDVHAARNPVQTKGQNAPPDRIGRDPASRGDFLRYASAARCRLHRRDGIRQATRQTGRGLLRPVHNLKPGTAMLRWIITFLVIALIAGVFGFTGVAGAATDIARILFYIFLVLLLVAIIAGLFRGSPPAP